MVMMIAADRNARKSANPIRKNYSNGCVELTKISPDATAREPVSKDWEIGKPIHLPSNLLSFGTQTIQNAD
jgi:hypothetical protein